MFLFGYGGIGGGILDLISKSLMFVCLLNAVMGGCEKHSLRCLSCIIGWMDGILWSYFRANICLVLDSFLLTLRRAIFLGIFLALPIFLSIRLSGYCLASYNS